MRWLRLAWIGALSCAALIVLVLLALSGLAREAWLVEAHPQAMVDTNKLLWEPPSESDPGYSRAVMKIYGNPVGEAPLRWLGVPAERFFHPEESKDPALRLLLVDRKKGEDPLQFDTVLFVGRWVIGGAIVTGALLAALWGILKRRATPPAPPAA